MRALEDRFLLKGVSLLLLDNAPGHDDDSDYDDDDNDDDLEDDDDDLEDENDDDDNDAPTMMMTWITLTSLTYSLSQMSVKTARKLGSMWSF